MSAPAWREGSVYKPCGQAAVGDQVRFWGEWHEVTGVRSDGSGGLLLDIGAGRSFHTEPRTPRWFRD